ncbi:MAG: zf-HC2 domain-containing protein [Acidobacteria bacterium]|nr:zf-HC2 domain-containing protein [Acidobacteriota bacterium]MCI0723670.1 zf-HC2 domain-containing protein [Acidobacteriota bacterium]
MEKKPCAKIQKCLDAYADNELLVETNQEVLKHLENCPACSEALQLRLRIKARLKQAVNAEVVPEALRARIRTASREERPIGSKPAAWPRWSLAAAAALLLSLSGLGTLQLWKFVRSANEVSGAQDLTLSEQIGSVMRIGISDHIHCVIDLGYDKKTLTTQQMTEKMGLEYSGLVPLLKARLPERFFISVGHRCQVNGREFVHMVLKREDKAVSVIITEKHGISFPASSRLSTLEAQGVTLYQDRLQSLEAVGFETKDHLAFVVSSLEHQENFQTASALAPTVSRFLNKL